MTQSAPDPKNMAKALRGELRSRSVLDATHSECLEIVARQHGVDNWNILAARADSAGDAATRTFPWSAQTATIPVLRIFAVEPALQFYVNFLGFTLDFGARTAGVIRRFLRWRPQRGRLGPDYPAAALRKPGRGPA